MKNYITTKRTVTGRSSNGRTSFMAITLILLSLLSVSCDKVLNPKYADRIVPWVYSHAVGTDNYVEECAEKMFQKNFNFKLIGDYSDDESGDASWEEYKAFLYLGEYLSIRSWRLIEQLGESQRSLSTILEEVDWKYYLTSYYCFSDHLVDEMGYDRGAAKWYCKLMMANLDVVISNMKLYFSEFHPKYEKYVKDNTEIVEWVWDADNLGDKYTGYLIVYEFNGGKQYALVSLIEWDDDSKSEFTLVAKAKSLREINEYLQ